MSRERRIWRLVWGPARPDKRMGRFFVAWFGPVRSYYLSWSLHWWAEDRANW